MPLQIDEQRGETILPEKLRTADHRAAIVVHTVQQQDRGCARTGVEPPRGDGMAAARNRNVLRVKARWTRHCVIERETEDRACEPEAGCSEAHPERFERKGAFQSSNEPTIRRQLAFMAPPRRDHHPPASVA